MTEKAMRWHPKSAQYVNTLKIMDIDKKTIRAWAVEMARNEGKGMVGLRHVNTAYCRWTLETTPSSQRSGGAA